MTEISRDHPVCTQEYAIYTPPIHEMCETITRWIEQRQTGGYIYGPSRFGKSKGIRSFLAKILNEKFDTEFPLMIWSHPTNSKSEREFWNLLLMASRFEFKNPIKPKAKMEAKYLFKQHLITLANRVKYNYIVILIDEAQLVLLSEWHWLLGLQNELDLEGYRLSIISVGSHQISFQPNFFARTGDAHIVTRFLMHHARFHGIRSLNELEYILDGYDEDSEWPDQSGVSYTKYFLSDAFDDGFRLRRLSFLIWNELIEKYNLAFKSYKPKSGQIEIPMNQIANLIERILKDMTNKTFEQLESNLSSNYVSNILIQQNLISQIWTTSTD
jgi:hypothetical protein